MIISENGSYQGCQLHILICTTEAFSTAPNRLAISRRRAPAYRRNDFVPCKSIFLVSPRVHTFNGPEDAPLALFSGWTSWLRVRLPSKANPGCATTRHQAAAITILCIVSKFQVAGGHGTDTPSRAMNIGSSLSPSLSRL